MRKFSDNRMQAEKDFHKLLCPDTEHLLFAGFKIQCRYATVAGKSWWRRGELNPRPQWSHSNIYVRILSLKSRHCDCGQTHHHNRQSLQDFAIAARDALQRLTCCRRLAPPSRCWREDALLLFKQRELIQYQHLMFCPDDLRGQPDILGTQPELQHITSKPCRPLSIRKGLARKYSV